LFTVQVLVFNFLPLNRGVGTFVRRRWSLWLKALGEVKAQEPARRAWTPAACNRGRTPKFAGLPAGSLN